MYTTGRIILPSDREYFHFNRMFFIKELFVYSVHGLVLWRGFDYSSLGIVGIMMLCCTCKCHE